MRRHLRTTITTMLAVLGLSACDNSILNVTPKDQMSDETVFADPALSEAFLNDIYNGMGHGLFQTTLWALTDDGHKIGGSAIPHTQSLISPSDIGTVASARFAHHRWEEMYSRIRQTNIFLGQIDDADFEEARKQQMKGEAYFLRAYFYHNLLRMYGGVPLITQVFGLNDDFEAPRNSFEETVEFIIANADSAAALLPLSYGASDLGRATKGAALALKARVLLFAASDLYHENPSGMPETGYTTAQDRQAAWRAAKDAAQAVIDLGVYALFRPNPDSPEEAAQNYGDLFLQHTSEEAIMNRYFLRTRDAMYNPGKHNGPNGYHTFGGNTPTQNIVDAYEMIDGSAFDWSNPEHAAAPYENRDPRFYASILFDGADWRERPEDVRSLDPFGIIQTFQELTLPDGTKVPGLDTRYGPIEDWNGTYSGYYLRKFIDPTVNAQFDKQEIPWPFFRYAEILLNYAEASIELGELEDAVEALNHIRRRAAMPQFDASMGQAALREAYRHERRVEMVFEEQRYFDVRRWMLAPEAFNEDARGIKILVKATDATDRSTYYDYEYSLIEVEQRAWDDRMYFLPIRRDEMNRNSLLVQNPGY